MATMWEYLTIVEPQEAGDWGVQTAAPNKPVLGRQPVIDALGICGQEGWELVTRLVTPLGNEYTFKRPKM